MAANEVADPHIWNDEDGGFRHPIDLRPDSPSDISNTVSFFYIMNTNSFVWLESWCNRCLPLEADSGPVLTFRIGPKGLQRQNPVASQVAPLSALGQMGG